jgi:hypothetical protein
MLRGGLRDPLVGRDVLYGLISGAAVAFAIKLAAWLGGTYYLIAPIYDPVTPNVPTAFPVALIAFSVLRTAGTFAALLLLGIILRREWLAWIALALIMTKIGVQPLVSMDPDSVFTWAGSLTVAAGLVYTAVRYGWVASLVGYFTASIVSILPLTLVPEAWYAGSTIFTVLLLVAMVLYGLVVSVGGDRLLPDAT